MLRFKCFLEESMSKSFESAIDMFGIDTKRVKTIRNFSMAEKQDKRFTFFNTQEKVITKSYPKRKDYLASTVSTKLLTP